MAYHNICEVIVSLVENVLRTPEDDRTWETYREFFRDVYAQVDHLVQEEDSDADTQPDGPFDVAPYVKENTEPENVDSLLVELEPHWPSFVCNNANGMAIYQQYMMDKHLPFE